MNDIRNHYSPSRRYASPLERPAPRTPRWMLAAGVAVIVIWGCVLCAALAYWRIL